MKDYGLFRVAAAVPKVRLADISHNKESICRMISLAEDEGVSLVVFPELSVTGCSCQDLFGQELILSGAEEAVAGIIAFTRGKSTTVVVGVPVRFRGRLYDCAAVIRNGGIKGIVPKICIPTCSETDEGRWFASGSDFLSGRVEAYGRFVDDGKNFFRDGFSSVIRYCGVKCNISPNLLFSIGRTTFGIEICDDFRTPVPQSSFLASAGAQVIVNLTASNEYASKHSKRREMIAGLSERLVCGYVHCSAGYGESTTDTVFGGSSMICEDGEILAENKRFLMEDSLTVADLDIEKLNVLRQRKNSFRWTNPDGTSACEYSELYQNFEIGSPAGTDFGKSLFRTIEPHPFLPEGNPADVARRSEEILSIQTMGLVSRMEHIGCRTAVIGVSGGLDSTLALIVTAMAFDRLGIPRSNILGITMPGLGTTKRTKSNAVDLMEALGVTSREISVVPAVEQHFSDIGHDPSVMDSTYENAQARERTQILMDIANQENGIVIGTGDLSELALGWCTYNGDHMSMYAVNASVPKTLIRHLVTWAAGNVFNEEAQDGTRTVSEILLDVTETPISPELKPADEAGEIKQKTEDLIGPYELHDFFIYNFVRYGCPPAKMHFLACKAFEGKYEKDIVLRWLKKFYWRFFSQQFKRSCVPDGPKASEVSLSPRGEWRMPSDALVRLWTDELEKL